MKHCKYASATAEAWARNAKGQWVQIKKHDRDLCTWAHYHPDALDKLMQVPPWLTRNALAGHLMKPEDCETCTLFDPGDAVE